MYTDGIMQDDTRYDVGVGHHSHISGQKLFISVQ